eukprot:gnl/Trimastix_PCT/3444.p1 GENE.gnl/Trimastix_PCT/3444~~gnl/Trimastix_PCT/3444.p1  ORF type:complete len:412 (+),score=72.67 gnl/Trimastix_PCT/3444:63-1238(+)
MKSSYKLFLLLSVLSALFLASHPWKNRFSAKSHTTTPHFPPPSSMGNVLESDTSLSVPESDSLIFKETFDQARLYADFPPRISNPNKRFLLSLACGEGTPPIEGDIVISRWAGMILPDTVGPNATEYEMREDVFGYENEPEGNYPWYVNFADRHLFGAYGGPLFAQDEMQAGEHPILGCVRNFLLSKEQGDAKYLAMTREELKPTPYLIQGAQRRVAVATDRNSAEFRPHGLYGNVFARVTENCIRRATTVLTPPFLTNLIAMEAPPGGQGEYTKGTIEYILITAYTAFRAAKKLTPEGKLCVVHTGNWGTGAYGGDKILMALLQCLAARMARVDRLVYHTFAPVFSTAYQEGLNVLQQEGVAPPSETVPLPGVLETLAHKGFVWGHSDGN